MAIFIVGLVVGASWYWFDGEIAGAWWHVWHGDNVKYGGVLFNVPKDRRPVSSNMGFAIVDSVGRFRLLYARPRRFHSIFLKMTPAGVMDAELDKQSKVDAILRTPITGERRLKMAGAELLCLEHERTGGELSLYITCFRDTAGPTPKYIGSSADREEFYRWVESAQASK